MLIFLLWKALKSVVKYIIFQVIIYTCEFLAQVIVCGNSRHWKNFWNISKWGEGHRVKRTFFASSRKGSNILDHLNLNLVFGILYFLFISIFFLQFSVILGFVYFFVRNNLHKVGWISQFQWPQQNPHRADFIAESGIALIFFAQLPKKKFKRLYWYWCY